MFLFLLFYQLMMSQSDTRRSANGVQNRHLEVILDSFNPSASTSNHLPKSYLFLQDSSKVYLILLLYPRWYCLRTGCFYFFSGWFQRALIVLVSSSLAWHKGSLPIGAVRSIYNHVIPLITIISRVKFKFFNIMHMFFCVFIWVLPLLASPYCTLAPIILFYLQFLKGIVTF